MDILISGKVSGVAEVEAMLNRAPKVFKSALKGWLLSEKTKFLGKKGKDGVFRKKIMSRHRWRDSKKWDTKVINNFNGKLYENNGSAGMSLHMGVLYTNQRRIHKGLEFLEEGGDLSSRKYMVFPTEQYKNTEKHYTIFKSYMARNMLYMHHSNGMIVYISKKTGEAMWVGLLRIRVNYKHEFTKEFNAYSPGMTERGKIRIDRAVTQVANGKYNV